MNAKESGFMVKAGMPAMEAIQSANITPARILNMEGQTGEIAPGFFADHSCKFRSC